MAWARAWAWTSRALVLWIAGVLVWRVVDGEPWPKAAGMAAASVAGWVLALLLLRWWARRRAAASREPVA